MGVSGCSKMAKSLRGTYAVCQPPLASCFKRRFAKKTQSFKGKKHKKQHVYNLEIGHLFHSFAKKPEGISQAQ